MSDIDRIVDVTITRQTTTPAEESFSGILIVDEFLKSSTTPVFGTTERIRSYGSMAEIIAAGFTSGTFVYKAASKIFAQNPAPAVVYVGRKKTGIDGTETFTAALAAFLAASAAWYYVVAFTRVLADQQEIADWVEDNEKFYIAGSADPLYLTAAGDISAYLDTNNYERSTSIYHPDVGGGSEPVPEAAWIGKMSTKQPGSATWAFKTLAGVSSYSLTTAQINFALAKSGNLYLKIAGVDVTQMGTVGSGEYIDIITGTDWLKSRIQNKVFTPLIQQDKIPFTDAGADTINSQLKSALKDGVDVGLLADFSTSVPKVADVSSGDKALRLLPDVKFTATYSGAIHKTEINGIISL